MDVIGISMGEKSMAICVGHQGGRVSLQVDAPGQRPYIIEMMHS